MASMIDEVARLDRQHAEACIQYQTMRARMLDSALGEATTLKAGDEIAMPHFDGPVTIDRIWLNVDSTVDAKHTVGMHVSGRPTDALWGEIKAYEAKGMFQSGAQNRERISDGFCIPVGAEILRAPHKS